MILEITISFAISLVHEELVLADEVIKELVLGESALAVNKCVEDLPIKFITLTHVEPWVTGDSILDRIRYLGCFKFLLFISNARKRFVLNR